MNVYYLPLEPYRERYTELLCKWTLDRFAARGINVINVSHIADPGEIKTGRVLDAHARCGWALNQMALLISVLDGVKDDDVIYVEDMFTPGLEALFYVLVQTGQRPRIFARNYAQSVDVHDFTFSMRAWMRHFELMVASQVTTLCAAEVHKQEMRAALWPGRIEVVGLPFDRHDVTRIVATHDCGYTGASAIELCRERIGLSTTRVRDPYIVFSSRLDPEKNPWFMLKVAKRLKERGLQVIVCTGSSNIRSSGWEVVSLVEQAERQGDIAVVRGADKQTYYGLLAGASLHLNTSFQDYVSYGVLEASALSVPSLCPAYKSFPEVFHSDRRMLYIPWSVEDAVDKAMDIIELRPDDEDIQRPAVEHHQTLDKTIDLFLDSGR